MRVDWETKTLVDCGRPSKTEEYIWQLVVGSDKKLYGCTYPNAKLVRYNPVTGKGEDLGRMSPTEEYNSFIAASADGFIYSGIGFKIDIAAYQIASGQSRSILPALRRAAGRQLLSHGECVEVYNGADGHAIASVDGVWARLDGWNATNATQSQIEKDPRLAGGLMLADGNHVHYDGRAVTICEGSRLTPGGSCKQTNQTHALSPPYSGREQNIFRIGIGPDGLLYGGTALPIHVFHVDPNSTNTTAWANIDHGATNAFGGGEFYSFLAWKDVLLGAAYHGHSPIMAYRPGQPWKPGVEASSNPRHIHFPEANYPAASSGWRPKASECSNVRLGL